MRYLNKLKAKDSFDTLSMSSKESFEFPPQSRKQHFKNRINRCKSMSQIHGEFYQPNDIRKIKERLMRTNAHVETSVIKKFTRSQKMTLITLALVDFMSFCSMSIMAPFFPKEAAEKGLSDIATGFVFSFYALVMFLTSPIFGKILPKIGPKFLFISGIFIAGSCNLLFGLLEYIQNYTMFVTFCLVIRGFEALGASAFSTASYVFVVNSFPNNIGSVLGTLETFIGLGMSAGPAFGGWLYALGGFELPFFVLGFVMLLTVPVNVCLLPNIDEYPSDNKNPSMMKLFRVPAVLVTGLVIAVVSSTWAFLDPTLEPHLREFNLTPEQVGLIFLLFSALYGIFSPIWGCLADRIDNHWSMMVWGLFLSTIGLLLLGPCPYITFLSNSVLLNIFALSILGISVALALLPTFQGVLNSAIAGGLGDSLSTYSMVAGLWSCMYSLGEVVGPSLGGFLMQNYGFPITATVMALLTFSLSIITMTYFSFRPYPRKQTYYSSDSGVTDSWRSISSGDETDESPLLCSIIGTGSSNHRLYTEEKVQYYEHSRKLENQSGQADVNQVTDVRGTVNITAKGSCEV